MLLRLLALWLYWELFGAWLFAIPLLLGLLGVITITMRGRAGLRAKVLVILAVAAVTFSVWGAMRGGIDSWSDLLMGLGTDLLGAVVTYLLIDRLLGEKDRVESLIVQMGSTVNDVALAAAHELVRRGHATDGSLEGVNLRGANLAGLKLAAARLTKARLDWADLRDSEVIVSNLRGVSLIQANLSGARFGGTSFGGAYMCGADLCNADLQSANLIGADLRGANLKGAKLWFAEVAGADFDEAILPDGSAGSPDTDMSSFTDPLAPRRPPPTASRGPTRHRRSL
jgi:hypothetical protein